ncbi:MAG TPA: DUF3500 domain-containing protein [Verrucomicrobiota bacterium]|nr:DUF3500 domain-containing protein [Verrucomicrobiota bacterium]
MTTPRPIRVLCALVLLNSLTLPGFAASPAKDMAAAATAFLDALTPDQRTNAIIEFKSDERFNWNFVPRRRLGLPFRDMTPAQQELGRALLRSGLSDRGYWKATNIIAVVELALRELENQSSRRDPGLYYITLFGQPGQSPWGWRLEGHHLSLNFTIHGDEVLAVTPSFFGSNPADIPSGPHQGVRTLGAEEDLGRELATSLTEAQRKTAIIAARAPNDIITGASRKANQLEPEGIGVDELTPPQRELLQKLIREYVFRYRAEIAERDLKKIEEAGFEKVHFAWAGSIEKGQGHYYRVQGPTFLLEYDNTQNRANHIHTVWRDFENDFGEDLLRKHYEEAHADHGHTHQEER